MSTHREALIILHFQALEMYPPIMNIVTAAEKFGNDFNIHVVTNTSKLRLTNYKSQSSNIQIVRVSRISEEDYLFIRLFKYVKFYFAGLFYLIRYRPKVVLYFETLSALPALIYKIILKRGVHLFAHYHEYSTLEEFRTGMILNRFNHWLENKLYKKFTWISHTNALRLEKFRVDHQLASESNVIFATMPNYPPRRWEAEPKSKELNTPYKLIMLGAIGYDNMYLKEIVEWVTATPTLFKLDFYSNNIDEKARAYLSLFKNTNVALLDPIDYDRIPEILENYDIGLVIYKPFSENTIYAVSNKVFEYHVCGLDVWFPFEMVGTNPFIITRSYPKIVAIDYLRLNEMNINEVIDRGNLPKIKYQYYCEDVYQYLYGKITKLIITK